MGKVDYANQLGDTGQAPSAAAGLTKLIEN